MRAHRPRNLPSAPARLRYLWTFHPSPPSLSLSLAAQLITTGYGFTLVFRDNLERKRFRRMSKYRVKQIAWTQNHSAISTTTTIITGCVYKPDNAVDKQWLERAAFPAPPSSFLFISLSAHFRGNIQKRYPTRSRSIGPTLFYSTVASPSTVYRVSSYAIIAVERGGGIVVERSQSICPVHG